MNKNQAADLFGNRTKLAAALGITKSAISQWPEELTQEQVDRVIGAAVRLSVFDINKYIPLFALNNAIRLVGSQTAMANIIGVAPMAVYQWRTKGLPAERVLAVEAATRGRVSRYELRPDIYPPPGHFQHLATYA